MFTKTILCMAYSISMVAGTYEDEIQKNQTILTPPEKTEYVSFKHDEGKEDSILTSLEEANDEDKLASNDEDKKENFALPIV